MPSPSDSSSVASASGSRGWSDSRRGMSGRGPGGARLLLYLGLCHLGLGAMVLAFSFTSMAFTSSARVRQSCPFWAGFFVSLTVKAFIQTNISECECVCFLMCVLCLLGGGIRNSWNHLLEETFDTCGMYIYLFLLSLFENPHSGVLC